MGIKHETPMAPQLGVGLPKIDKIRIKPKEKDKITPGCIIFGRLVIQSTMDVLLIHIDNGECRD